MINESLFEHNILSPFIYKCYNMTMTMTMTMKCLKRNKWAEKPLEIVSGGKTDEWSEFSWLQHDHHRHDDDHDNDDHDDDHGEHDEHDDGDGG